MGSVLLRFRSMWRWKWLDQLRTTGKVTRGRIGVTIQEVTRELAESFGLSKPSGALVSNVEKDGPADKAGIQVSDVILKFDGKPVNSSSDLAAHGCGDQTRHQGGGRVVAQGQIQASDCRGRRNA